MEKKNSFSIERTVKYYETDQMCITHHSNYVRWMEEAKIAFLDSIGCDYARMEESGVVSPVVSINVNYRNTTTFPDVVTITVTVKEFNGVRLRLEYEMRKADGTLVCTASSENCFQSRTGKLMRLQKDRPEMYANIMRFIEAGQDA